MCSWLGRARRRSPGVRALGAALGLLVALLPAPARLDEPASGRARRATPRADPPAESEEERLTPTFDWPERLIAEVEVDRWQRSRVGEATSARHTRATFRMQSEAHPEGELVRFRKPAFEELSHDATGPAATRVRLLDLAGVPPGLLVSPTGAVIRLAALDELRADLEDAAAALFDDAELDVVQRKLLVGSLMEESRLLPLASEFWGTLVGMWAGREFVVGQIYLRSTAQPLPLLGGIAVPTAFETVLRQRLRCPESEGPRSREEKCVELQIRSRLESDALDRVQAELRERAARSPSKKVPTIEALVLTHDVLLLSEWETLIPHRVEIKRRSSQVVDGQRVESLDESTLRFSYRGRR